MDVEGDVLGLNIFIYFLKTIKHHRHNTHTTHRHLGGQLYKQGCALNLTFHANPLVCTKGSGGTLLCVQKGWLRSTNVHEEYTKKVCNNFNYFVILL